MSICPHPCPSDPTGPPDRCLGRTGPVKVDSGQKQVTGTRCSGGGEVRSCSEGSAVEPGEQSNGKCRPREKTEQISLRSMKLYVAWRVRGHALPAWFI